MSNIKSLKKKAWKEFSRYIRLKHSTKGMCTCYTCGKIKPWKEMQAGHGIAGRNNSILFEERVVRPQCYGCNCGQGGRLEYFSDNLIKEYGLEEWRKLLQLKWITKKFTEEDLKFLHLFYKDKAKEYENNS